MAAQKTETRQDYKYFLPLQSRWMDNDLYGHVNNVTYYSYFDTVVNYFLIEKGGLDIHNAPVIGVVVESHCNYMRSVAYPDLIQCGLRIGHLGNSSVRYEIGIFKNDEEEASAAGHFIHVFVERDTNKPVGIPKQIRDAFETILAEAGE
ncbi:MAG: acyl-CoA thioesterase [Rhodospirillales bacterium]|nr:acyl-CoA thioesterase [Rhodospirillales bacterium]